MKLLECELSESLHVASQYLAAAAYSFISPKEDHSHLNFGWNNNRMALVSRDLNEHGLQMALNYSLFQIEFLRKDRVLAYKPLTGNSHNDMVDWLKEVFRDLEFEGQYFFNLEYKLPRGKIPSDFVFEFIDRDELLRHASERSRACKILQELSNKFNNTEEVRTWPKHLNSAVIIPLKKGYNLHIGLGIADQNIDDYFYYTSLLKDDEMIDVHEMPELKYGKWISNPWKGSYLKSSGRKTEEINFFLNESIKCLKKNSF